MKLKSLFLLALAALLTLSAPRPARAAETSFDFFYDALAPMGEWLEVGDYGLCWKPSNVDEDWAPYSDGYWSYTDAGWTWVSYEDFGGIVYHYGRWAKVEDEGWVWVPDYEWGPAWVSWRKNDDYVGWAPLPAEARFEPDRGISVWADTSYDIGPGYYNFCHTRDFGAPVLRPLIIRRSENIVFIGNTVNITNISYNRRGGYVFNGGLDYAYVNRFQSRPIPALKLVRNTNVTVVNNRIVNNNVTINNFNSVQRGNQLTVLAPTVVRPQAAQLAARVRPNTTRVIAAQKVNRGWANVPNDRREAVRASFAQQTQGKTPETTVATAPRAEDLKVVPVKADPNAKISVPTRKLGKVPPVPQVAGEKPDATTKIPGAGIPQPGVPEAVDPAKIAREKAAGKKPGKGMPTAPAVVQDIPANPPVEGTPGATAVAPVKGVKPGAKKMGKGVVPAPTAEVIDNPPAGVVPSAARVVRGKAPDVKPGIVKPFNAPANDAPENVRKAAPTAAVDNAAAIEKRNAAAEAAAQKQNMAQEAARERAAAVKQQQQQQEAARRGDAQQAAAARLRMQQQQQQQQQNPPDQPAARKRQVEPQMQQNQQAQQQQQEILRERAAQAAEGRQRAAAVQQQSQAAAIARQQAAERAQAQAAARKQVAPQVMPPQQRNVQQQPVAQPQQRPPGKGKRPLTPEEEAALKKGQ